MQLKRSFLRSLASRPVGRLLRPTLSGAMPIFMLHRFTQPDLGIVGHSPDNLRRNLEYLRREGFRLVSMAELLASDESPRQNKSAQVALTLDDGHSDFLNVGLPILAEFDCPITVFVSTGVIDRTCWYWWDKVTYMFSQSRRREIDLTLANMRLTYTFDSDQARTRATDEVIEALKLVREDDRLAAFDRLQTGLEVDVPATPTAPYAAMSWEEMERCAASGLVSFGPHTLTHPSLPTTGDDQAKREILGSWERLQKQSSAVVPIFAYPFGSNCPRDVQLLEDSKLLGAVTTEPRYAGRRPFASTNGSGRFTVPRFAYPDDMLDFVQVVVGFERLKMAIRGGREGWRADGPS
jgi:peptidoglycan/xylan/chitin deacetylase (PgdA/CDA1 family)